MVPFVGPSYQLKRKKADTQRSVNLHVSNVESGQGKARQFLKSIPGLTEFSPVPPPPPPVDACDLILEGPADQTLRVQYLFNGDFVDSSGNYPALDSHPGSTIATEIVRCGAGALHLPLYSSYAKYVGDPYGFAMSGDFKIACFIYLTGVADSNPCILSMRNTSDPGANNLFVFGVRSTELFIRLNNVEVHGIGGAGSFVNGQWYEVSVERTGSDVVFKKNRVQIGTTQTNGYANDANAYLSVGYEPYVYHEGMVGYVDSLSVWTA